jgi:ribosomal protein L40E
MTCAKCNRDNPADAQFCQRCGAQLELTCPACGAANGLGANFCKKCGARLTSETPPASVSVSAQKAARPQSTAETAVQLNAPDAGEIPEGERKTVTALFADIKGSMELMEDLDPEAAQRTREFRETNHVHEAFCGFHRPAVRPARTGSSNAAAWR